MQIYKYNYKIQLDIQEELERSGDQRLDKIRDSVNNYLEDASEDITSIAKEFWNNTFPKLKDRLISIKFTTANDLLTLNVDWFFKTRQEVRGLEFIHDFTKEQIEEGLGTELTQLFEDLEFNKEVIEKSYLKFPVRTYPNESELSTANI